MQSLIAFYIAISVYYVPSTVLNDLPILIHLIIIIALYVCFYYDPHFTDEPTEVQKIKKISQGGVPIVAQWINDPMLSPCGCRLDPWPCTVD